MFASKLVILPWAETLCELAFGAMRCGHPRRTPQAARTAGSGSAMANRRFFGRPCYGAGGRAVRPGEVDHCDDL
eukprot:6228499-Alexandrium_andersonii.AAC.1